RGVRGGETARDIIERGEGELAVLHGQHGHSVVRPGVGPLHFCHLLVHLAAEALGVGLIEVVVPEGAGEQQRLEVDVLLRLAGRGAGSRIVQDRLARAERERVIAQADVLAALRVAKEAQAVPVLSRGRGSRGSARGPVGVHVDGHRASYSTFTPAFGTISFHFRISRSTRARNSSAVLIETCAARAARNSDSFGLATARISSACSRSRIGAGVPAGKDMPHQIGSSYSENPPSATVGTSGSRGFLSLPVTARARIWPAFTGPMVMEM